MPQRSAGIVLYRTRNGVLEVLIIHPGGPFWTRKDDGAWSIPKGEFQGDELPEATARREFNEETGGSVPGPLTLLGTFRQPSGKLLTAFAAPGDFDTEALTSINFSMEWPPRSGRTAEFPEADRAGWFSLDDARRKLLRGQVPILDALVERIAAAEK